MTAGRAQADRPGIAERGEAALVALGSGLPALGGAAAAFFPQGFLSFLRLPAAPDFLVRQAGVLYVLVAVTCLVEYRRSRGVGLLVAGEGLTSIFFLVSWLHGDAPAILELVGTGALLLAAATRFLHTLARERRWARVRLRLVQQEEERVRPAGER